MLIRFVGNEPKTTRIAPKEVTLFEFDVPGDHQRPEFIEYQDGVWKFAYTQNTTLTYPFDKSIWHVYRKTTFLNISHLTPTFKYDGDKHD